MSSSNSDDCDITSSVLTDYSGDTITIDTSGLPSSIFGPSNYSMGAGAVGSSYITSNHIGNYSWNNPAQPSTLQVQGNAEFEGDVKIKGVSIAKALDDINKRLAILVPDPKKLEHFEALKKAYNHYKTLEALCELPIQENKE